MPPVDSTAQVLASGSQDLAALAGLFCTNSVERNALGTHFGYGTVASSGLSILGVLGLVRSSVKLVLGLERCHSSGFSLDSLRGIFGYQPHEEALSGELYSCDEISVTVGKHNIVIEKTRRTYDSERKAVLACGRGSAYLPGSHHVGFNPVDSGDRRRDYPPRTLVNVGRSNVETVWLKHPWTMAVAALVTTGVTSWLILVVRRSFYWALYFATVGLHSSMFALLAIPLWHSYAVNTPSKYASARKIKTLFGHRGDFALSSVSYTEYDVECGKCMYLHGNTRMLWSWPFRALVLCASTLCATSYVCQYAVLKDVESAYAGLWIGLQASFALARLVFWLKNPEFDDFKPEFSTLRSIEDTHTEIFSLYKLIRALPYKKHTIPLWAWNYIRHRGLRLSVSEAYKENCDFEDEIKARELERHQRGLKSYWYDRARLGKSSPDSNPGDVTVFVINIDCLAIMGGLPPALPEEFTGRSGDSDVRYNYSWRLGFWKEALSGKIHPTILVYPHNEEAPSGRWREEVSETHRRWLTLTCKSVYHTRSENVYPKQRLIKEIVWRDEIHKPRASKKQPGFYYWHRPTVQPGWVIGPRLTQHISELVNYGWHGMFIPDSWHKPLEKIVEVHEFVHVKFKRIEIYVRQQRSYIASDAVEHLGEAINKSHENEPMKKEREFAKALKTERDSIRSRDYRPNIGSTWHPVPWNIRGARAMQNLNKAQLRPAD